jgi:hypothetical protein
MTCRTIELVRFAERYHVSCHWLFYGDLKGLLDTTNRGLANPCQSANAHFGWN